MSTQQATLSALQQVDSPETAPVIPPAPIEGPAAWRGADLAGSEEWMHRLSDTEIAELDAAIAAVQERGLEIIDIHRDDFPLPTLGLVLDDIHEEILRGRGFTLIRGVPVERYSMAEVAIVHWGIGTYLGKAVSQNGKGHVLGHVRDIGNDANNPNHRIYQTTTRQEFHTDSCDIVALLCLRQAKSGGQSSIVSSVTLFNEMMARRPDLAAILFEPLHIDRRGEVPAGEKPYYRIPVFNYFAGTLSSAYVRPYTESARRFDDVPPLTDLQVEALDMLDALAEDDDLRLVMDFQPGDIQYLHNTQIMHGRDDFEDWPEPERKRHLLRLWLCPADGRPLPDWFARRWGSTEIGNRGGIMVPGVKINVPLEPV